MNRINIEKQKNFEPINAPKILTTSTNGGTLKKYEKDIEIFADYINKKNNKKSTIDSSLRDSKFEEFWEAYGKKTGKQSTTNQWAKLNESEYDEIIRATKKYVELRPDAVYRKDPERFLKHKVYEEDFLKETRPVNQTTTALSDSSFEAQIPEEWL